MKVSRSSHGHLIAALLSVHKMEGLKNPHTVLNRTKDPIKATQYVINTLGEYQIS